MVVVQVLKVNKLNRQKILLVVQSVHLEEKVKELLVRMNVIRNISHLKNKQAEEMIEKREKK